MQPKVSSPVPDGATERVVARHDNGKPQQSEFVVDGKVVAGRLYDDAGFAVCEWGEKEGRLDGVMIEWMERGVICSAIPYRAGVEHGRARQWGVDGKLLGSYEMRAGSGWDLWWQDDLEGGGIYLSEARRFVAGERDGFEWWLNPDQRSVHCESHYRAGLEHGIRREWDEDGRLKRGFPHYFLDGKKVTRGLYLAASKRDRSLPAHRAVDDRPQRSFPAEVSAGLRAPPAPVARKTKPERTARAAPKAARGKKGAKGAKGAPAKKRAANPARATGAQRSSGRRGSSSTSIGR